jgi:hypothetical protein
MSLANTIIYGTKNDVEQLIAAGADVDEADEYGFTPLIEAAIVNDPEIAKLLIEHGADVNQSDSTKRTALHWAVDNHHLPLCQLLLENNANPNAYTSGGQSVLVYPLLRKQAALKKLLYQYRANLNFAQDFINTKLLAHRYQLLGQVDIVNAEGRFIEINLEGFVLEFTLSIVQNSLERYRNNFAARNLRTYFNYLGRIIESFTTATELLKYQRYTIDIQQHSQRIDALLDSKLLLIPIACEGHAITFINYGNLLVRCDRGEHSRVEGSVVVYQINNRHEFNPAFIKYLLYQSQTRDFINHGIKEFLDLRPIAYLPLPAQITGNCSWANVEASIPAMLFLLMLQKKNSRREIVNHKTAALEFYRQWLEWDKDRALEECIESFHRASKARKASKAALLGSILAQQCNYDIPKDVSRADKILPILTIPDYQYVLKSYLEIYWKNRRTKVGKNLVQLLDLCGVKISY